MSGFPTGVPATGRASVNFRSDAATAYVAQLKQQSDPSWSPRQKAKRLADAQDRLSRLERCPEELAKVKEVKSSENNRKDV